MTPLVDELAEVLPECAEHFEVVLVNDGSADDTWDVIAKLVERCPWVRGLDLMRNCGQHNATLCGLRAARYATTVTMDDDLQHPTAEIPKLLSKLSEGFDVVYGVPEKRVHSATRNVAAVVARWALVAATRDKVVGEISAFRALRTALRQGFEDHRSSRVLLDVLLGWATRRIATVRTAHHPRREARSNYGWMELTRLVAEIWIGYTAVPLRFASWLGFAFVLFGLGVLGHVFWVYFSAGSVPGFPFLASIVSIFAGVQLFVLGLMGEYVARLHERSLDRPAYVIRDEIHFPGAGARGEARNA